MAILEHFDVQQVTGDMRDIWSLLNEAEQELFANALCLERFKKNEMIYREGDTPERLLCLLSGKVKVFRDGLGGRCLINRVLRPVQYFGYRASMAGEPYVTAAAAFEESVIASVPMSLVYGIMEHNYACCSFFLKSLAADLGVADQRIVSITQKHVRGRLAESLLSLLDIYGVEADGMTLNLRISREDLANLSNMTTSNAIRTLSSFSDEGILTVRGRTMKFLDIDKIRKISDNG